MKKRVSIATCLLACAALAHANDGLDLAIKSKSMAAASAARSSPAPVAALHDPLPEMVLNGEQDRRAVTSRCGLAAAQICYDAAEGRMTFAGARQYMPAVSGLTAEGIVLRRDRVVFRYSFK